MTDTKMGGGYLLKLTFVLLLISAVTALLLGFVNAVTVDRIKELKAEETQAAMKAVMPTADKFVPIEGYVPSDGSSITSVLEAYNGSDLVGYCVQAAPGGFAGPVSMVVGVDLNSYVTGVRVVSHTETAGLGSKAQDDPAFAEQYIGKTGNITVKTGTNSINSITGATVTSSAVTKGVNEAITAVSGF